MIPISLTIKGLFSYQKEQTINFDRLIEGQLFGIFGTVGSGKSSILEAISFALYGETERLNTRDDRNYNMMNLKSDELLIDFVFDNFDEKRYRFVVKGKRHGKKFDKVNTFDRAAYVWTGEVWQPLAQVNAEHVLRLSYDNFRRTIIIPQGKFQEFLQLTDKSRTDMLRDIFQLDKYEFFHQAASLEKKNNASLQLLQGKLSSFDSVTAEGITMGEEHLRLLQTKLDELKTSLSTHESKLKEQETLKQLFRELADTEEVYRDMEAKSIEYNRQKDKLADYEYCERYFKADLMRMDELVHGINKRKESLLEYEHKLKICDTQLMELQQEFVTLSTKYHNLDKLKDKRSDYEKGISITEITEALAKLNDRIKKGKHFVNTAQKEKLNYEKTIFQLRERLKNKRVEKPDVSQLADVKTWFQRREHLEKNKEEQTRDLDRLTEEIKVTDIAINELFSSADLSGEAWSKEGLQEKIAGFEKQLEEKTTVITHLQLQMKLSDFTAALHRGEACPLCGAVDHPNILRLDNVQSQLVAADQEFDDLKMILQKSLSNAREFDVLEIKKTDLLKRQQEAQEKQDATSIHLQEHLDAFVWSAYDKHDAASVDRQLEAYKRLDVEITAIEQEINESEVALKKAEADRDAYDAAVKKIEHEHQAKSGSLELLVKQLKLLKLEDLANSSIVDMEQKITDIHAEIDGIIERHEFLQRQLQEQQQLKVTFETRLSNVVDNMEAEKERLDFVQEKVESNLYNSKFTYIEEVKTLLGSDIVTDDLRKNIERFFQQLFNLKEQLHKLQTQVEGKSFDQEKFSAYEEALDAVKKEVVAVHERYVADRANQERLLKLLTEKQSLQKDLQKLQERAESLHILKNLFKGSAFVSYLSSVYLQQLCDAANKRFYQLTQQQLKLEINERNEFQVRDYLNDGKVRLAKTLSGGQIFQASLSLALALAESVQQQHKSKQNFFFLDEGFGSLDSASLSIAFDTLKSLRKENRVVGIISHVEDLQQEIDVFLKVENNPFTGTQIKGNWEL
ncbi:SMC family ATPase [Olivibacter sp. SDN3]|uniref:AAA family ATPase n=1 Tax=Olivibacter sp. SDN3 TaxID=2764720 RepID=UPI0016513012|nr:SMC family ATPase [Olivibacter sp. SDN3]QNL48352.1 SMC family ATPase [Olivibacter sp. SDN3]